MFKPVSAAVSAALFASVVVAGVAPADAATTYYSSCYNLHKTFRYGVAKSYAAAQYQYRTHHYRPAYTAFAQKVYWANYKRLDRDRDGTACEVTR
jgi:hypothetical protein